MPRWCASRRPARSMRRMPTSSRTTCSAMPSITDVCWTVVCSPAVRAYGDLRPARGDSPDCRRQESWRFCCISGRFVLRRKAPSGRRRGHRFHNRDGSAGSAKRWSRNRQRFRCCSCGRSRQPLGGGMQVGEDLHWSSSCTGMRIRPTVNWLSIAVESRLAPSSGICISSGRSSTRVVAPQPAAQRQGTSRQQNVGGCRRTPCSPS